MNRELVTVTIRLACISILMGSVSRGQDTANQEISPEAKAAIEAVQAAGGQVLRIAANSMDYEASFHLTSQPITDENLEPLKSIPNLVWMNLANTKITNDGLEHLSMLPLTKLHLEKTQIGDEGLNYLKELTNLEYLNLYATRVTDVGLEHLSGLKHLKHLYVWQSGVTDEGIKKLNESLPDLLIVGEIKMIEPGTATEPAAASQGTEPPKQDADKAPETTDESAKKSEGGAEDKG